jgi:hypothetical protein
MQVQVLKLITGQRPLSNGDIIDTQEYRGLGILMYLDGKWLTPNFEIYDYGYCIDSAFWPIVETHGLQYFYHPESPLEYIQIPPNAEIKINDEIVKNTGEMHVEIPGTSASDNFEKVDLIVNGKKYNNVGFSF